MKINNSAGKANFSQRNNEFKMEIGQAKMNGYCMCNVTSVCMAASYAGLEFPNGRYSQPEDNLCKFICTNEEVLERYKKNFPKLYDDWKHGEKNAYWPNEIHDILCFGFNRWMKKDVAKFNAELPLKDFMKNLFEGKCMPTSMTFGPLGHIICVVGFETSLNEDEFKEYLKGNVALPPDTKIIFDDPYGYCTDFVNGKYVAESGNDRTMTLSQFVTHSKPLGKEAVMCHVLNV